MKINWLEGSDGNNGGEKVRSRSCPADGDEKSRKAEAEISVEEMCGLFERFMLTPQEDEEIRLALPQFSLYKRSGDITECFCTACMRVYETNSCNVKHKRVGVCPLCGAEVLCMSGGRVPARSYKHKKNFVIFRAVDGFLLASAVMAVQTFHDAGYDGISPYKPEYRLEKCQLYVFGEHGAARFRFTWSGWKRMADVKEPTFYGHTNCYGYADHSYTVISADEYRDSCLRYCGLHEYMDRGGNFPISWLAKFSKHPALEKLCKCGFELLVDDHINPITSITKLNVRSTDIRKMLRLSREEIELLRGCDRSQYLSWLNFRKLNIPGGIEKKFIYFQAFGRFSGDIRYFSENTGLSHMKVINYLSRQSAGGDLGLVDVISDYRDYIRQCKTLGYDLKDTAVSKPKNLRGKHAQLTELIEYERVQQEQQKFSENTEWRKRLEFRCGVCFIRQPKSSIEIIEEGAALSHCVGGYTKQHSEGSLTIMFLRKADEPDKPYYTIEVNEELHIVQCRGYKNNWVESGGEEKPPEIHEVEAEYQKYLDSIDKDELYGRKKPKKIKRGA